MKVFSMCFLMLLLLNIVLAKDLQAVPTNSYNWKGTSDHVTIEFVVKDNTLLSISIEYDFATDTPCRNGSLSFTLGSHLKMEISQDFSEEPVKIVNGSFFYLWDIEREVSVQGVFVDKMTAQGTVKTVCCNTPLEWKATKVQEN